VNEKSNLLRLAEVMDRLRSPGGCPWDAEQTHESLLTYLLEETYEFIDAVERAERDDIVEELGDVLLQVFFHARIGQERDKDAFSIEDVASAICEKLIRRHPHVFQEAENLTAAEVEGNWERIKAVEKSRKSPDEGVPLNQPALSLASKLLHRAQAHGHTPAHIRSFADVDEISAETIGELLLSVVSLANQHGVDPEFALRTRARNLVTEIQ
jgi:XTP/dITP diphosphohydrolase